MQKETNPERIKELNETLLTGIREGSTVPQIRRLINQGAEVNCRDFLDQTPLILALTRGSAYSGPPLVALLLEMGADPTMTGALGITPLDAAASGAASRSAQMVILELEKRGALKVSDLNRALHRAVHSAQSSVGMVEVFLHAGAEATIPARGSDLAKGVYGALKQAVEARSDNPATLQALAGERLSRKDRGISR